MSLPLVGSVAIRRSVYQSIPKLCAAFSTTSLVEAQAKKAKKGTPQKRKTPMRKGLQSKGVKSTKRSSGSDSSSLVSRTNPFLEPQRRMAHLMELVPENAVADQLHKPMALTARTIEATRKQGFGLTRELARQFKATPRPRSVLRQASIDLFDILDKSSSLESTSSNILLQGPTGVGISTLILQSVSYALESSWIVVYIPRAINLVDSSSPYAYSDSLRTYLQPAIAQGILERMLAINRDQLSKLATSRQIELDGGVTLQDGLDLTKTIEVGLGNNVTPAATQQILELVMTTLSEQKEIPFLLAIDGVQALFSTTRYRDADYRQLQSYELAVPRLLQACLRKSGSGALGQDRRGLAMTACSLQHKEWPVSIEVKTALRLDDVDAYAKLDEIMLEIIEECQMGIVDIPPSLSLPEAVSLYDLARDEGGLWIQNSDEALMSKLAECGGNIGTFDRSLRRSVI